MSTTPKQKAADIVQKIAQNHEVTVSAMNGPSRVVELVVARQEAMYEIFCELGWSLSRIGRLFNRDHSTVTHAIGAHCRRKGIPAPSSSCENRVNRQISRVIPTYKTSRAGFVWTDDHTEKLRKALASGLTTQQIAERLGCVESTVRRWAKKLRESGKISPKRKYRLRGELPVEPARISAADEKRARERMAEDCARHLDALRKHHGDRSLFGPDAPTIADGAAVPAAMTARRLVEAARYAA